LQSPQPRLQVEAHLLDLTADLYGQEMEIAFVEKLRDEQKFSSRQALREQIQRDIEMAQGEF